MLESKLAKDLGVPRKKLRTLRAKHLAPTADFVKGPEGIEYTVEGLQRMQEKLGAAMKPVDSAPSTPPPSQVLAGMAEDAVSPPRVAEMRVVKVYPLNPRLLLCELKDTPQAQRVRVRDNRNFLPGMVLKAVHENSDLWTLAQRLPRWRGKW